MYAVIAFLPIIFAVAAMAGFNWPARRAMPIAWLIAAVLCFFVWRVTLFRVFVYTILGFLSSIDTLLVLFGALLIMNTLTQCGAMRTISKGFMSISKDPRIQLVVIGCMFGSFMEGAAGYGTPAAICAPLLITLGYPPLCAAMCCLILDSVCVTFGAVGLPPNTAMTTIGDMVSSQGGDVTVFTRLLAKWAALPNLIIFPVMLFVVTAMMCKMYGKKHSFRQAFSCIPFIILCTIAYDVPLYLCANYMGTDLPTLIAALVGLLVAVLASTNGFLVPKDEFEFPPMSSWEESWLSKAHLQEGRTDDAAKQESSTETKGMGLGRAWIAYIIIAVVLVVTRVPMTGISKIMNVGTPPWGFTLSNLFGAEGVNWTLKWAWSPGIIPFTIVALLCILIYRMDGKQVKAAWNNTFRMVGGAVISLAFGIAMVQLFRYSNVNTSGLDSMLLEMAKGLAALAGRGYVVISPFIGVVGAFMSGSATVSCILFSALQYQTAELLAMPKVLIVALQVIGGAMGNMVCVHNIVAACTTCGTIGSEGRLLRSNILPCIIFCAIAIAVMAGAMSMGIDPMPL
ncbi:MAG: L-lactate permease [Lachnospiraceae bacterium]|nr:L-lactate permease [Lachnospiraceae bacterium]